jgi:hypothetical protein
MWTPSVTGALHKSGTTDRAFGVEGMVCGEPGAALMVAGATVYT